MCKQESIAVVPPPKTQTVKNTIKSVVENIIWRAYVAVSRIAKANAIAPRKPETIQTLLRYIFYNL